MKTLPAIVVLLVIGAGVAGCERPEPIYKLKSERGVQAVTHYDDMAEQPKYIKIRKGEYDKRKAILERRTQRDVQRGIFRKESKWDF